MTTIVRDNYLSGTVGATPVVLDCFSIAAPISITIIPGSGNTSKVETTTSSDAVANPSNAHWLTWPAGTQYTPVFTDPHEYEIYYDSGIVKFTVDGELLHNVAIDGTPWSATLSLYLYASSINSSSAQTSNQIMLYSVAMHRLGKDVSLPQRGLVTTANTYNFKYGPGLLHRIIIGTTSGTLMTIYDDTSGTSNTMLAIGAFNNNNVGAVALECKIPFANGLKIVSTGTWSASFIYE